MSALLLAFVLAADPEPTATARAEAFVAALAKGDIDAAVRDFDDAMRQALPPDKVRQIWDALGKQAGAFDRVLGSRVQPKPPYEIVFVTCQFANARLDLRISVNAKKQIGGLQIVPPAAPYAAPDYVRPDAYDESEVTVGDDKTWELPATLSRPKGEKSPPAVVLVHGSGPHDRDETIGPNKPFRDLAGGLASRGIAVLRYVKRTKMYGPTIKPDAITVDEETTEDVRKALVLLRKTRGIDAKRLYVVGHSLGATLAPKVAAQEPDLAGIVLLAGLTRPLEDAIVDQIDYLGGGKDEAKEQVAKVKAQAARVKDPKLTRATPSAELPLGVPAAYWLSLRGYDPAATAAKLSCRILVLQGDRDYQVTLADFAGWEKALAGKPNATLKRFPALNHLFAAGSGKSTPAEYEQPTHVAAEVVDAIAAWVKR